jgi:hypothetical protein
MIEIKKKTHDKKNNYTKYFLISFVGNVKFKMVAIKKK